MKTLTMKLLLNQYSSKNYWSTLTQSFPSDKDIERTKEIIIKFGIQDGQELTMLYLYLDVILLADVFENFVKTCTDDIAIKPLTAIHYQQDIRGRQI